MSGKVRFDRREMLGLTSRAVAVAAFGPQFSFAAENKQPAGKPGAVIGEVTGARIGERILSEGGNAVDAAVAAALAACVVSPHNCGVGGYGGHLMIALARKKKTIAIDFNTAAPTAARADMFPLDERGIVRGQTNDRGWLAAGVPGTLAGLHLALKRYGTRSFREVVAPAIELAQDGFPVSAGMASAIRSTVAALRTDPASARLLLKNGEPLQAGDQFRNPDLAHLLTILAKENSVEAFYRGDASRRIADEFQRHGGLVTAKDLAAYQAREIEPLELNWRGFTVRTAPLTAGGLTVLEALSILKALKWDSLPADSGRTHARLEALRIAWHDRLQLLGDPQKVSVPVRKLLSREYAQTCAAKIEATVNERKPLPLQTESRPHVGTIHLSAVDADGNMVAVTLTHGNSFGARVTVEGLGLILGHGMSRFEPRPGHPNSVGPGKRPLHNMCPTIVLRDGQPVLALGGAGGRKIPNAVFDVLVQYLCHDPLMEEAIAAPRLHTEGNLDLTVERRWPQAETEFLQALGYKIQTGNSAVVSAVSFDSKTGECRAASR